VYLLDTNVISEPSKQHADPKVVAWFGSVPDDAMYISVLTLGEIRKGVEGLPEGKRRKLLEQWLTIDVLHRMRGRIVPVDERVADVWGKIEANTERSMLAIDGLLAATAIAKNLTLVTRNVRDFNRVPNLTIFNPWEN
jgi:toxin FitB